MMPEAASIWTIEKCPDGQIAMLWLSGASA